MMSNKEEIEKISLVDKYTKKSGQIFLTGIQALVRLPLMQIELDKAAGINTGGFISGYRGSPLGGLDKTFWENKDLLEPLNIKFQSGLNEDLAATAVWGTQQVNLFDGAKVDGVFGIWYGKGPGVDRTGDVFKHANNAGTSKHGGVLVLAGDDHTCKSSSLAHQSEYAFVDSMIPVLNPSNIQEILEYGLLGLALSRYSGCWISLKVIAEFADSSATIDLDKISSDFKLPIDFEMPADGLNIRWPDAPLDQELRLHKYKLKAAQAFAKINRIDKIVIDSKKPRLGIITTGKSYADVLAALDELGIDQPTIEDIGLRIYKVGMSWPLEPSGVREFAENLEEIIVIEEKRSLIESQIKDYLYGKANPPKIIGKFDESDSWILPSTGELTPTRIAEVIGERVSKYYINPQIYGKVKTIKSEKSIYAQLVSPMTRIPTFCSGCPHNTSTKVPEGSRAVAGIGCHYMVIWADRNTDTFTHMGGEGVPWIGQSPFTDTDHIFANLGDGTYFHSGILAIRAAVSAKVNITYKILFNDAVAMTGGQPHDGSLNPIQIAHQVYAEGVSKIIIVTDQPEKYTDLSVLPADVNVEHRDQLDRIQKEFREIKGTSIIIYDQTCATEKRRRRKRGLIVDLPKRTIINESVCEGCGDCGIKSNCTSILPVETEFGRKRQIDQSSCNKDFSCVEGFCPSFVTITGGTLKKNSSKDFSLRPLSEPLIINRTGSYNILVTGVGGTGVITIGALLGMAAHIEGKGSSVLDMTGLAQKGGAVYSHIKISNHREDIRTSRIINGGADLVVGADLIVSSSVESLAKMKSQKTVAVINNHKSMPASFTRDPNLKIPTNAMISIIENQLGQQNSNFLDFTEFANVLFGDTIASNLILLGYIAQKGLLPLGIDSINRAIELNGVSVEFNKNAFFWGRNIANDTTLIDKILKSSKSKYEPLVELEDIVETRRKFLIEYQNNKYSNQYTGVIEKINEKEKFLYSSDLTKSVAKYLFKLMTYKDEYEVARLHSSPVFLEQIKNQFDGNYKIEFNLAPPIWSKRDPRTGEIKKQKFGPWMLRAFRILSHFKILRGTKLDLFGYTSERKQERQLLNDYLHLIDFVLENLTANNLKIAIELASLPEGIRGYGHVKDANIKKVKEQEAKLLEQFLIAS